MEISKINSAQSFKGLMTVKADKSIEPVTHYDFIYDVNPQDIKKIIRGNGKTVISLKNGTVLHVSKKTTSYKDIMSAYEYTKNHNIMIDLTPKPKVDTYR